MRIPKSENLVLVEGGATIIPVQSNPPANTSTYNASGAHNDDQLIGMFLESRKSENTRKTYGRAITAFRAVTGGIPLATVTLADFNLFVNSIIGSGAKPATVRAKVAPIKSLFTYAARLGYLHFNVGAASGDLPAPDRIIEEKVLTEGQVRKLLQALEKKPGGKSEAHRLLAYCLYATGARISEFLSLRVRDFRADGEGHYLILRGSTTKSGKTRRVGLPEFLAEELGVHVAGKAEDDPIFGAKYRGKVKPLSRSSVNAFLKRTTEKAGLPHCSPHMLRHSVATHALKSGQPLQEVSAKLGHSGVNITASIYDHTDKTGQFKTGLL